MFRKRFPKIREKPIISIKRNLYLLDNAKIHLRI